jgi:hypothetical protein
MDGRGMDGRGMDVHLWMRTLRIPARSFEYLRGMVEAHVKPLCFCFLAIFVGISTAVNL